MKYFKSYEYLRADEETRKEIKERTGVRRLRIHMSRDMAVLKEQGFLLKKQIYLIDKGFITSLEMLKEQNLLLIERDKETRAKMLPLLEEAIKEAKIETTINFNNKESE